MVFSAKSAVLLLRAAGLAMALGGAAFGLAQAGKTMLVEPPAPLLPSTMGGFTKATPAPVGDGIGLVDLAQAAVLKEDGLKRFERSEYISGSAHGTVTAYQFIDASGAYAAFCLWRGAGSTNAGKRIGDATVVRSDGTILQSGVNLVVAKFDGSPARTNSILTELVGRLPKVSGPAGQPPLLPALVREKGLVANSVRYALGPLEYKAMGGVLPPEILAFDKSGEAVTAEYQAGGSHGVKGILTLLLYPTPTIAGDEGRAIENQFKANSAPPGTAKLRREGPLLILATGGFSGAEAQEMVDSIHLRNEVTWNKPLPLEFHAEVQKTASLLKSIAVFSGVGALAAVLLALFLGGARAGIRVLMGKPAASEPEFLRIDLSGGPAGSLRQGPGEESSNRP